MNIILFLKGGEKMRFDYKKITLLGLVLTVTLVTFSFTTATFAGKEKISIKLLDLLESSNDSSKIPVIVQTRDGLKEKHKKIIQDSGGTIKENLPIIKGFSATLVPATLNKLAKEEDIFVISFDDVVKSCLDSATATLGAPSAWNNGITGKGVTVAVLDDGIYPHPDLTQPINRIVAFKDFINGRTLPYDDSGHGTHVAGIIAGNGTKSQGIYKGIAPEASLVGVKVLDSTGGGRTSNVIAGLQWVVQNKNNFKIKVLNLSLGAPATVSYISDPLSQAVDEAWKAGLVVVAAAGNYGPSQGTILTPGINPQIITVGAVDNKETSTILDDVVAVFSSRGPTIDGLEKPDLVAPGVNITSLATDTSYIPQKDNDPNGKPGKASQATTQGKTNRTTISNYYYTMSGSSMATPMVTGIVALLQEQNPLWPPNEIKNHLLLQAIDLGFNSFEQGKGQVSY